MFVFKVYSRPLCCLHNATNTLPAMSKALLTSLLISIISTYRSHIWRSFDDTIRRLYFRPYVCRFKVSKLELKHKTKSLTFFPISPTSLDLYSAMLTFARFAFTGASRDQMDCPWIQIYIIIIYIPKQCTSQLD